MENLKKRASHVARLVGRAEFPGADDHRRQEPSIFTVRTTEKEPELVQAAIDRLFRENGEVVAAQTKFRPKPLRTTNTLDLKFADPDMARRLCFGSLHSNVAGTRVPGGDAQGMHRARTVPSAGQGQARRMDVTPK